MELSAPAKVNLYLKVLFKRPDGYHEIETLFERVSIFDKLSVEFSKGSSRITCDNDDVPTDKGSLMMRVIEAFNARTGVLRDFRVHIEKHIPIAAGLGGGSSDAAALLLAINKISGSPLGGNDVFEIASRLGSDIPFFLGGSSFAFGRGRGEILEEIDVKARISHILITPPFPVSTKDVYGKVSLSGKAPLGLTKGGAVDKIFAAFLQDKDTEELAKNLRNDLQDITLRDFPILEKVFFELKKRGALGVLLSGSGPTVFGIFKPAQADKAREELLKVFPEKDNWKVFQVVTV